MDEQFVSIGKAAKMLGMSIEGLRKWEREGRLIPVRTVTNHRRYRVTDLHALMHDRAPDSEIDSRCILYARVSLTEQQEAGHLERQLGRLTAFAAEQHWTVVAALTDVASGVDEKRRGLHKLLDLVREHPAGIVVVESRERLTRFGLAYLETYLHAFGVRLAVMEPVVQEDRQELIDDLIDVTTAYSARLYGKHLGEKLGLIVRQAMETLTQEVASE